MKYKIVCPYCGKTYHQLTNQCPNCGNYVPEQVIRQAQQTAYRAQTQRPVIVSIVSLSVFLVLLFISLISTASFTSRRSRTYPSHRDQTRGTQSIAFIVGRNLQRCQIYEAP